MGWRGSRGSHGCYGPITYFLISPSAQTITVNIFLDDGPSLVYLNGASIGSYAGQNTIGVNVPQGPFALSFVPCSNNGGTIAVELSNAFITQYGLSVDFDRVFHRNGL